MGSPYLPDLSQEPEAEPLDISQLLGGGAPQPQAPAQAAAGGGDAAKWIKLALIAPFLAKAGPHALTGFLQGFNQNRGQQQAFDERQRQTQAAEAARQQQAHSLESYRQQTLQGQQQTRQQALLKQYTDAITAASTTDEVQALRESYRQQAMGSGMRPGVFDTLAMTQTPDKLQGKRIAATWAKLPAESKQEALKNGWTLNVDGQNIPFDQWSAQVGGFTDPATGKVPLPTAAKTDKRGFAPKDITLNGKRITANYDPDTGQYFAVGDNQTPLSGTILDYEKPAAPTGGEKPLTQNQRANVISTRRNQWTRFTKAVTDRQSAIQKVDSGVAALSRGNRNAATQAIIIGFNKLLDETSVVREGEYARTEQLVPLISRIEGAIQRVTMGGASMTDNDLRALANEAKAIAGALEGISQEAAANLRQGIEAELGDYNIPPDRVFGSSTIGTRKEKTKTGGIDLGGGIVVRPK